MRGPTTLAFTTALASTMLGACYDPVVDATQVLRLELVITPGVVHVGRLQVFGAESDVLLLSVERVDATESGTVTITCDDVDDVPAAIATLDLALDDVAAATPIALDAFGYGANCAVSVSADADLVTVALVAEVRTAFRQGYVGNTLVQIAWWEQ